MTRKLSTSRLFHVYILLTPKDSKCKTSTIVLPIKQTFCLLKQQKSSSAAGAVLNTPLQLHRLYKCLGLTHIILTNMSVNNQDNLSTIDIMDGKSSLEKDQRSTAENSTTSHANNTENDTEPLEKVATTLPQAISREASATASATLQRVETRPDGSEYPTGLKLTLITIALCLGVFLMALDNSIIATAIPHITDQFNSLNDVGWYGSGE